MTYFAREWRRPKITPLLLRGCRRGDWDSACAARFMTGTCLRRSLRPARVGPPAKDGGLDRTYNFLLHDLVFVDRDVPDTRNVLPVHVFQRAPEILGPRPRFARPACDVKINVAVTVTCQFRTNHGIQSDRQFDGDAELTETRHHI